MWGRKGEERFGLLGKVVSYHGRNLEFLQGHGLGGVSVSSIPLPLLLMSLCIKIGLEADYSRNWKIFK